MMNHAIAFLLDYLANYALFYRLIAIYITLALLLGVIIYQAIDTIKFRGDYVSKFRWGLLTLQIMILLSIVPVVTYIQDRYNGDMNDNLRNLSTLAGGFAPLAFTIAFIVLYIIAKIVNKKGDK